MASIARDKNGHRRILFVAPDGKRPTIRLGKVSQRAAETVKFRVEQLLAAKLTGHPLEADTIGWIDDLEPAMADKLAAVGLIPKRGLPAAQTTTLAGFIAEYISGRPNMKPNTLKNYRQTERILIEFFGKETMLADVTPGACDDWHAHEVGRGQAPATIGRNVKRAKQYFRAAVRKRLIAENPFAEVKAAAQVNKSREFFVTREATEKIIVACPDAEWRLIVALARYGGLRMPSETYALRWGDVDWERQRICVQSPKTEHHSGGKSRLMPLFPELRPHLEAVFDAAEPGTEFVVTKHRGGSNNLRTQFQRIVTRAGLKTWPRLFQNLRASRETELTQDHPLHVVVAWIGNSAPIAARHYLQVTEVDFERAARGVGKSGAKSGAREAQNPAQQPAAESGATSQKTQKAPGKQEPLLLAATSGELAQICTVPPRGVEPRFSD